MQQQAQQRSPDVATAISVPQAAARLGVHEDTVRRWITAGRLPHFRIGISRRIRILVADVDRMVETVS